MLNNSKTYNMNIEITQGQYNEIKKLKLTINHIWWLQKSRSGPVPITVPEVKMLINRFLVGSNGLCTETGEQTWKSIEQAVESPLKAIRLTSIVSEEVLNSFNQLWASWPGTDNYSYNGKTFTGNRTLKSNKQVCLQLFNGIIGAGKWTGEQIIGAAQKQIESIKVQSYNTGQNKMTYLPALEPWLRQGKYEVWAETEATSWTIKKETEQYISI